MTPDDADDRVRFLGDRLPQLIALVHFPPVRLHAGLAGEWVLQRVGRICLQHLIDNEAAARVADAEGIHQMRVAVRRLRALIATFAPLLPHEEKERASTELRWFADVLGEARNLDVFISELIAPAPPSLSATSEFERLVRAIERRRLAAHVAVVEAITSDRYQASVQATRGWLDRCEWRAYDEAAELRRPIGDLAPILLERRFRQVKKRGRNFRTQSQVERHELRIAIKKLRYAADSLTGIYSSKTTEPFIRRLKRLQDDLGLMNDLSVARDIVASMVDPGASAVGIGNAARRLFAWHGRRLSARESKLRKQLRLVLASIDSGSWARAIDAATSGAERRASSVPLHGTLIRNGGCVAAAVGTTVIGLDPGARRAPTQNAAPAFLRTSTRTQVTRRRDRPTCGH